jgi:lysophospholipase L1-like esterase
MRGETMTDSHRRAVTKPSRRNILIAGGTAAGILSAASLNGAFGQGPSEQSQERRPLIAPGDTVLFQGDSITDAGRKREAAGEANSFAALGSGYAWLAAAQLIIDRQEDNLKIFNRGISGNKVYQLAERWQADCLGLKPNVLSILIGVNDFWHKHKHNYDGTLEKYEADYHDLLVHTREQLPEVKLVVCEPFVLKAGAVDETWFPEFDRYRAAARRVANEADAVFVPFQSLFDQAAHLAPAAHWAADGVHPTVHGAALMAHWWLNATSGMPMN